MQQTISKQDLIKYLQSQQQTKIECTDCGNEFFYNAERNRIKDGLYELGIRCPICNAWYHSYFITDEIVKLPRRNRKEINHYKAEMKRLNRRERKAAGLRKVNGRWIDARRIQDKGDKAETVTS